MSNRGSQGLSVELTEESAPQDPLQQFRRWQQHAEDLGELLPNAMALATAGVDGRPSARFVILRGLDERGFIFYTNYNSRKALDLEENRRGSLAFNWPRSQRQVIAEGAVDRVTSEESDAYFESRPRETQVEAWASPQSQVIPDRQWLERRWQEREAELPEQPSRPEWWGGYRLQPDVIEFWQQRPQRMHDRLRYHKKDDGTWSLERLAP